MRKILISLLVSLSLVVIPAVSQAATKNAKLAGSEQQVLVLLNEIRQQHGLTPFTANAQLRNAARFHSIDMLQKGYFDHNSPSEAWDARVARYLKAPTFFWRICDSNNAPAPDALAAADLIGIPRGPATR